MLVPKYATIFQLEGHGSFASLLALFYSTHFNQMRIPRQSICVIWQQLLRSLMLTVLRYGAEGCTLVKYDENMVQTAELRINSRRIRITWTEHCSDENVVKEHDTPGLLFGLVVRRRLPFFGHTIRDDGYELVT